MKHAYLILTHGEFEVLKLLIASLDDFRNDIYIHFDKKVEKLPNLETKRSRLVVLDKRVSVSWGDVSMLEAEMNLFEKASNEGSYMYYHLLSGVDMPIKSQDCIHDFFYRHKGKEFIGFSQGDLTKELYRKIGVYHPFPKKFRGDKGFMLQLTRAVRSAIVSVQVKLKIARQDVYRLKKGPQWISITHDFLLFLLKNKSEVMRKYRNTFCADEVFVQTLCWNSQFRNKIYYLKDPLKGCMRTIRWQDNHIIDWQDSDFDVLMKSDALFARKFNRDNLEIVQKIEKTLR